METYQVIIGAIALLAVIIAWVMRKYATGDATRNAIQSKYKRLREEGLPEGECLFRLLSTRGGWKRLPEPFLQELSKRLGSWERIADFIRFSESEMLDRDEYPKIAQSETAGHDLNLAMRLVTLFLTRYYPPHGHARKNPLDTEMALRLCALLAPDDGCVLLNLAVHHYLKQRYREAAPLFERGLKLVNNETAKFERLNSFLTEKGFALPPELSGSGSDTQAFVKACKEMYESCMQLMSTS